jgi:glycosyltransferase involved in cell wall biosynthesis
MTLRVLHLTTVASPIAGAELTSLLLARELPKENVELEVCTISPRGQLHDRLDDVRARGSSLGVRGLLSSPLAIRGISERLRTFRPDIIHSQLFHAGAVGAFVARQARLPFVLTRQYVYSVEWYRGAWAKRLDRWVARQADTVVAISTEVRRFLDKQYGLTRNVRLIHNAADVGRFAHTQPASASPDDRVNLVYVASLHPRKAHAVLFDAVQLLKQRGLRVNAALVGDGEERAALERLAREKDIVDSISFLGWRNDVDAVFATAHVYVHSASEEAFGIAIAEGMAAGLPVVATDVGGIPDVVANGTTGFLVPARDGRAMADKLQSLVEDPDLRRRMGDAGRERAFELFSPQKLAKSYAEVFREVADTSVRSKAS